MDWYCAEYKEATLYELHDGKTAVGLEDLDELLMRTIDPATSPPKSQQLNDKDHAAWMQELRKQQIVPRAHHTEPCHHRAPHRRPSTSTRPRPGRRSGSRSFPWVHEETDYLGERDMRGTVRDAKDAQRVYNVNVSSLSESVNDAPKNRVVGYKGQFGKPDSLTRRGWEEAPNKRFAFLEVEPITIDGKPAPFPQAFNVEPAIMGLAHAISQADNDLKATGRFHDASLAEAGPEQSGKAIIARQRQDELSNGGFIAGHLVGMASVCRQLIALYRVLYTTAQIVRITGDDDQKRKVMIFNGEENDPRKAEGYQADQDLKDEDYFDIGGGAYDVEVKPAPQAGSRREEDLKDPGRVRDEAAPGLHAQLHGSPLRADRCPRSAGSSVSGRTSCCRRGSETKARARSRPTRPSSRRSYSRRPKSNSSSSRPSRRPSGCLRRSRSRPTTRRNSRPPSWRAMKAQVDRIFAEIEADRLRLDAKKSDDDFKLGEHKKISPPRSGMGTRHKSGTRCCSPSRLNWTPPPPPIPSTSASRLRVLCSTVLSSTLTAPPSVPDELEDELLEAFLLYVDGRLLWQSAGSDGHAARGHSAGLAA